MPKDWLETETRDRIRVTQRAGVRADVGLANPAAGTWVSWRDFNSMSLGALWLKFDNNHRVVDVRHLTLLLIRLLTLC